MLDIKKNHERDNVSQHVMFHSMKVMDRCKPYELDKLMSIIFMGYAQSRFVWLYGRSNAAT